MEFLLDGIMYSIVAFLDMVIPAFNLAPEFVAQIDSAISTIISLLSSAGYFVPLNVLILCFGTMISVDLFSLTVKLVKWAISIVRG